MLYRLPSRSILVLALFAVTACSSGSASPASGTETLPASTAPAPSVPTTASVSFGGFVTGVAGPTITVLSRTRPYSTFDLLLTEGFQVKLWVQGPNNERNPVTAEFTAIRPGAMISGTLKGSSAESIDVEDVPATCSVVYGELRSLTPTSVALTTSDGPSSIYLEADTSVIERSLTDGSGRVVEDLATATAGSPVVVRACDALPTYVEILR
jgi:hypothetical protein